MHTIQIKIVDHPYVRPTTSQSRLQEFPEKYYDEFPSLCRHLTDMFLGERYVFSADFLARGYRFDRLSTEKMWRTPCCPEHTTFQDVAQAVFTGNPDCLNVDDDYNLFKEKLIARIPKKSILLGNIPLAHDG